MVRTGPLEQEPRAPQGDIHTPHYGNSLEGYASSNRADAESAASSGTRS